jgi:hypothetical protein
MIWLEALEDLLGGCEPADQVALRCPKSRVYRLEVGKRGLQHSVVAKPLDPADAQRVRLVTERWLPALGLGDRCARLLAVAADRRGRSIWHVYEDISDDTLAARPTPERVEAAVDLVAELHMRAARHAVLPDVRRYSSSRGMPYFIASVSDAVAALEALMTSGIETPPDHGKLPHRLYERLTKLLGDAPRRAQVFEAAGGPDTLLHGDLWTNNIFVTAGVERPWARLVDWDRVGVGPFAYDLSTFLFRFSAAQRPWILERYRHAVSRAGWSLASAPELYLLFDTTERARYANRVIWPVLALLREHAELGIPGAGRSRAMVPGSRQPLMNAPCSVIAERRRFDGEADSISSRSPSKIRFPASAKSRG